MIFSYYVLLIASSGRKNRNETRRSCPAKRVKFHLRERGDKAETKPEKKREELPLVQGCKGERKKDRK